MAIQERDVVVGVFRDRRQAQEAVHELKSLGFRDDQIGIVARDGREEGEEHFEKAGDEGRTYAEEGAVAGIATGAGVGGLWALGIAAGLLPAIGPVIAGGLLASVLASAATGAVVGGIAGALIGLGVPEEEAEYYEDEFKAGRVLVTVKPEGRHDEAVEVLRRFGAYDVDNRHGFADHSGIEDRDRTTMAGRTLEAREEELLAHKEEVDAGEVRVHKDVHTEHRTLEVPVTREEVVVERHPVAGREASSSDIGEGDELRVPISEEQVHVEKRPVVTEEVTVGKRKVHDKESVSGTVRKEDIRVEQEGDLNVREDRS